MPDNNNVPMKEVADFVAYRAQVFARRPACVDMQTQQIYTYGELDQKVAQCAGWLSTSLQAGSRVAILSRNSTDMLILFFACIRAGMIFMPLNWRLPGKELQVLMDDGKPDIFIYQQKFTDAAEQAMSDATLQHVLKITATQNPFAEAVDASDALSLRQLDENTPALILFTSGTTGKPKGVIITVKNCWTASNNFCFAFDVGTDDVLLCDMPLFHVAGLGLACSTIFQGATVLISDRFDANVALQRINDPNLCVTHYFAVTQMVIAMMQEESFANTDFSRLKAITVGGSPLPKSLVAHYVERDVTLINTYGISEAMGTVVAMPLDREVIAQRTASSGKPAILIDVRLVNQEGEDAADGEVGEIWLHGSCVTPGYWQQPEATAQAFANGWFRTGDAAVRDEEGFYFIVDRWKDMYISGGENVYPAEVEATLIEHPAILEVGVVGVPDERWGESGCAFVVLTSDHQLSDQDLVNHCRERIATYKTPKHLRIVDELPRTASGKIRKEILRGLFLSP